MGLSKTVGRSTLALHTANIMFGDLIDGISTLIGGMMPGTGKTRCMRTMMISIEERLAESAPSFNHNS